MWAIVPIKTFERAKQRLSNVLSDEERRSLTLAMARDVLTCLSRCKHLTGTLIVSRTHEATILASAFNTEHFTESPDANLATALTQATRHLLHNFAATGVFVVPADVPGITTQQIDQLIEDHIDVTLLPDSEHIGTNGMICSPPLAIPYIFDGKSFKPHSDAAYSKNLTPRIISGSCFALDIDTPKDLLTLLQQHPQNQTVSFLHRSGIAQRLSETKQPQQESL